MCADVQGTFALTLTGRGADTVVAPGTGGPWAASDCVACGGCVDTCPTGAITRPGTHLPANGTRPGPPRRRSSATPARHERRPLPRACPRSRPREAGPPRLPA
ncbi:4Fe-4S binding protein [Streptomyces sp. NPDC097704]|uniref:4Fe-4S binding protein n=1 Tax=Streptomyces sp. NPDC097704 TaxID=3157101 RepID=UPI0033315335